jgi:hypothetical protein
MLRHLTPYFVGGVAFYDIGQGSCGAVCAAMDIRSSTLILAAAF